MLQAEFGFSNDKFLPQVTCFKKFVIYHLLHFLYQDTVTSSKFAKKSLPYFFLSQNQLYGVFIYYVIH